jgi:DNA-binding NtrC family response regulator
MNKSVPEYDAPETAQILSQLKVLVIDGRDITRRAVSLILTAAGADVTGADSIAEAQAFLAVRPFDAVLTDIDLPGLGRREGRPVLAAITGPNACVPVVEITQGGDSPAEVRHAAGMMVEIGAFIDPGRICRALAGLAHPPPRAAAA